MNSVNEHNTSTAPAIKFVSVSKTYGTHRNIVHALRDINLELQNGTFTAIMGASGSGKTTLLQCAAGLERPVNGNVFISGKAIANLSETELTKLRRKEVGFIFQSFNLLPSLTVEQNVILPVRLGGWGFPARHRILNVLKQVGIEDKARAYPHQISGGQQQRVAIARALYMQPQVLFADEPTGALDRKTAKDILGLLRQVVDEARQTVVMVTHDPLAASYADKVIFLADGEIKATFDQPTIQVISTYMAQLER